jgi:hypothetical protein
MSIFNRKEAFAPVKGQTPPAGSQAAKEAKKQEETKKKK